MGSGYISQWISITFQLQIFLSIEKFLHGKWIYFTVDFNYIPITNSFKYREILAWEVEIFHSGFQLQYNYKYF